MQSSLIKFIILINKINTNIIKQKQYMYSSYFHDLSAKKKYLLTFESQKLNYFGKKVGPAF